MPQEAASVFAAILDLLACLGEQIYNRKTLYSLCLSSKFFNVIFTPFLYFEVRLTDRNAHHIYGWSDDGYQAFDRSKRNPHLKYARAFGFDTTCFDFFNLFPSDDQLASTCMIFNQNTQALLKAMPELIDFSWQREPIHSSTVSALHRHCPKLQSLKITYTDNIETVFTTWKFNQAPWDLQPGPDLSHFKNLRKLEVYNISGYPEGKKRDLISVLLASSGLDVLGLSIAREISMLDLGVDDSSTLRDFLRDLCEMFLQQAEERNYHPLKLRKLVLGHGFSLNRPKAWPKAELDLSNEPIEVAYYLSGLTDLDSLVEVHIRNDRKQRWPMFDSELSTRSEIAWETLFRPMCPRLKRLSIFQFDEADFFYGDVRVLESMAIQELIIEWEYTDAKYLNQIFAIFKAKAKTASMGNEINEAAAKGLRDSACDEGVESNVETRVGPSDVIYRSQDAQLPNMLGIRAVFSSMQLPKLLSELKDCVLLQKLNIGFDLLNTWDFFHVRPANLESFTAIVATVSGLKNLTHLCIRCIRLHRKAPDRPGIREEMAQQFTSANGRLRYVKIGKEAWRIDRSTVNSGILQSLDEREVRGIDSFDLGWPDEENFQWD